MHADYSDIRSRIAEAPLWFDEVGAPRYAPFTPWLIANIHAREAVLAHTRCQSCGVEFKVALSWADEPNTTLAAQIPANQVHPGDPPNIGCCPRGPSMSSESLAVLEYWAREVPGDWQRNPSLERPLRPRWEED